MKTYLFPGQGSQFKGMGENLFDDFADLCKKADEILGYSIRELCTHDSGQQLHQTEYTQPALYVVNTLFYKQKIRETGQLPDFVAGHSLGEYNALQSAGVISFEDGLKLVKKRGELMAKAPKGAMLAILGNISSEDIKNILQKNSLTTVDIANFNSASQTILSGLQDDINKVPDCFDNGSLRFIPLNTSGAFHSRYMESARQEFESYLKSFTFSKPSVRVISNVTARIYYHEDVAYNLANQITHPVRWLESMQYLLNMGDMDFEELGPGTVLAKLISSIREQPVPEKETGNSKNEQESSSSNRIDDPSINQAITLKTSGDRAHELAAIKRKVNDWNKSYPPGTAVVVKSYDGKFISKSKAVILFGHRAAIYLEGYNGYFALDDVTPV